MNLTTDFLTDLETEAHEHFEVFYTENILKLCDPTFYENMVAHVAATLYEDCVCCEMLDTSPETYAEFVLLIEKFLKTFLKIVNHKKRSYKHPKPHHYVHVENISERLDWIKNAYQPPQRTNEWYQFRHNLITASNMWKIFGSEANLNSLICEKCKPLKERSSSVDDGLEEPAVNTMSTLHWGVKYEPITAAIYAFRNKCVIGEFGCIQHPKISCIGASPDGIVLECNENPQLVGRMLEIKNVVNREITGIPSMPYWIQMQIQMEVCNLEMCDFVETVFKEYGDNEEELFFQNKDKYEYNGVILYFIKRDHSETAPKYVYMPICSSDDLTVQSVNAWIDTQKQENKETYVVYKRIYWYCEIFSCVCVHRSQEWFAAAAPKIEEAWALIEHDRVHGHEHRLPKKTVKKEQAPAELKCLMDLTSLT